MIILCFITFLFVSPVAGGWVSTAGARTVMTTQTTGSPNQRSSPMNEAMAFQDKIAASVSVNSNKVEVI